MGDSIELSPRYRFRPNEGVVVRFPGGNRDDEPASSPMSTAAIQGNVQAQESETGDTDDSLLKCWICYATEEDDEPGTVWIHPCQCRGSMKWVHDKCLQMYIDTRIGHDTSRRVLCPQCKTPYVLLFPQMSLPVLFLDSVDHIVTKTCPYIAMGMLAGSLYWAAVSFGALSLMQVFGQAEALEIMEQAEPMSLLICLPTIPVFLVAGKLIPWEETVLSGLQAVTRRVPVLGFLIPGFSPRPFRARPFLDVPPRQAGNHEENGLRALVNVGGQNGANNAVNQNDDQLFRALHSGLRIMCSALLLPAISSAVGKAFFSKTQSNWRRCLYGGLTFIAVKGAIRIYYLQNMHNIRQHRRIKNFSVEGPLASDEARTTGVQGASGTTHVAQRRFNRRPTPGRGAAGGEGIPLVCGCHQLATEDAYASEYSTDGDEDSD
ncbi:unnamed protein product [Notodromas monacha]|uniref:E3 ubiquitin-protein ligase MARCHF5 n=1 Tax=Notodromas monacha TaxID=399045 RepID=A0A7R9BIN4_9CRUS|nr:unnamed protein product [Notodromas monacha]CAG0916237.1 unnamed protein product [Notodromas monacha]